MEPTLHSFGGSALDRWIYDFESVPDAGGDAAGAGASTPDAGGEAASDAAGAELASAWAADDPDFIDAVDARATELFERQFGSLMPLLSALANGEATQGAEPVQFGPLDPLDESFGPNLDARLQAFEQRLAGMVEQITQPLAAREEAEREATGNTRVDGWIADDLDRNGQLGAKATAQIRPLAEALLPQFVARYGNGPRAAEMAVQRAVATIRDLVTEASSTGVEQHNDRLGKLAGVRPEIGAGGGSGVVTFPEKIGQSNRELAQKYGGLGRAINGG